MDDLRKGMLAELLAEYLREMDAEEWPTTIVELAMDLTATVPPRLMHIRAAPVLDHYVATMRPDLAN